MRDMADSLDGLVARGEAGRLVPTPGSMVLDFIAHKPTPFRKAAFRTKAYDARRNDQFLKEVKK